MVSPASRMCGRHSRIPESVNGYIDLACQSFQFRGRNQGFTVNALSFENRSAILHRQPENDALDAAERLRQIRPREAVRQVDNIGRIISHEMLPSTEG